MLAILFEVPFIFNTKLRGNPSRRCFGKGFKGHQIQAKIDMVYRIFLGKQGKRVYTIDPERRVYIIEASDPEKEEQRGFPQNEN